MFRPDLAGHLQGDFYSVQRLFQINYYSFHTL